MVARLRELGWRPGRPRGRGHPRSTGRDPTAWRAALDGVTAVYITPARRLALPDPRLRRTGRRERCGGWCCSARGHGRARLLRPLLRGRRTARRGGAGRPGLRGDLDDPAARLVLPELQRGRLPRRRTGRGNLAPAHRGREGRVHRRGRHRGRGRGRAHRGRPRGRGVRTLGPARVGIADVLDEIAKETGKRAAYVPRRRLRLPGAGLIAQGLPGGEADLWTDALEPITSSREAPVLDGVRRALGREPRDFADFVRDAAARGGLGLRPGAGGGCEAEGRAGGRGGAETAGAGGRGPLPQGIRPPPPPAPAHPAGAAASTGPDARASRRNALGLSPRTRLNAALNPNASA